MTLLELLELVKKHLKLVVAVPVACALVMGLYSLIFMPNEYTATTSMYVLAKSSDDASATSSDYTASQMITNDVATLLESSSVKTSAAKSLGLENLDNYKIVVDSKTTTRVITLNVTGKDREKVANVANELAKNVGEVAQRVSAAQAVNVVDEAQQPDHSSGPNRLLYTVVAALAGLFVAIAAVVVMDMINVNLKSPEEIEEFTGLPVIGKIPEFK